MQLLWGSVVWAQQLPVKEDIYFSGVVVDAGTTRPLVDVNCRWKNSITTTDAMGRFAFYTQGGDTIRFSHVGFEAYEVVVPDTLLTGEYILAVFMSSDTIQLPEVVVVHRFGARDRQYRINARNNVAGVVRDAFKPTLELSQQQNQQRILDEYAASTNKGHVDVKFGVGLESYQIMQHMRSNRKLRNQPPALLKREEIDLVKMLYTLNRKRQKTSN